MNIRLSNGGAVGQPIFSTSTVQHHPLGTLAVGRNGRKFRYVKVGGTELVVGDAIQQRAQDTDHDQLTCRATAVGATELLITTGSGSGALDANEYAGGLAVIDTTPGLGFAYPIKSHAAIGASSDGSLVLDSDCPIQVALTASSRVTLVKSPYDSVIQCPVTTATGVCVGGAVYNVGDAEFGWVQSGGPGAALIDQTPSVGEMVTNTAAAAGALTDHSGSLQVVAHMMVTGVNGKVLPVFWLID